MKYVYHLIHDRGTPLLTETRKLYNLTLNFHKPEVFIVVYLSSIHRERLCFISFMGVKPPYKEEPYSCIV